jgi:hypothetical protein
MMHEQYKERLTEKVTNDEISFHDRGSRYLIEDFDENNKES